MEVCLLKQEERKSYPAIDVLLTRYDFGKCCRVAEKPAQIEAHMGDTKNDPNQQIRDAKSLKYCISLGKQSKNSAS